MILELNVKIINPIPLMWSRATTIGLQSSICTKTLAIRPNKKKNLIQILWHNCAQ